MVDEDFESTRNKECRRKRRYPSEQEAREMAEFQMRTGGPALGVYECIWCRGWHLAKQK